MDNRSQVIYLEGIKAYKEKNFDMASSIFVKLSQNETDSSVVHFFAAVSLFMIKKYSLAVTFFKKVIDFKKNYQHTMKSCIFLGYIYIEKNMLDEAFEVLKKPVEDNYSHPFAYSLMGYIAHSNKKYSEADAYYKKCLEENENHPGFNNNYGYNLLIWKKDFEESVGFLEKAVRQKKNNYAYMHSLGWALFMGGRYADAQKILSRVNKVKSSSLVKKHLEMVNAKLSETTATPKNIKKPKPSNSKKKK